MKATIDSLKRGGVVLGVFLCTTVLPLWATDVAFTTQDITKFVRDAGPGSYTVTVGTNAIANSSCPVANAFNGVTDAVATERVLLQTERSGTRGNIPEEAVLSVLMTDEEEYAGFMNLMLPMIAEGTALEGSKQDGWHCEVRNSLLDFRSEWDPGTGTAFFRYDPSGMTLERISINNMLLELFRPGD